MDEEEVKKVFEVYLNRSKIQYFRGRGAGPDFEFEDGSVAEAKGSEWADVGAVLRQVAEYYLKSPAVTIVAPADSLNLDRGFRLWMLERIMRHLKFDGKPIKMFLVDKVTDNKYKIYTFNSLEDLWKEVGERIEQKCPGWHVLVKEKVSFVSMFSMQEGNELFKLHTVSLISERGSEIEL